MRTDRAPNSWWACTRNLPTSVSPPRTALIGRWTWYPPTLFGDPQTGNFDEDVKSLTIATRPTFAANALIEFPFTLPLPNAVTPGFVSPEYDLRWFVRAQIDRAWRLDYIFEREFFIYNAPNPSE